MSVKQLNQGYYDEEPPSLGRSLSDSEAAGEMVQYYLDAGPDEETALAEVRRIHQAAEYQLNQPLHPDAPPREVEYGLVREILGPDTDLYLSDFEERETLARLGDTLQAVKNRFGRKS